MNPLTAKQLDNLLLSAKQRIDAVIGEDGEQDESRSEPLCEEWWEWIVAENDCDDCGVVFVPQEWIL